MERRNRARPLPLEGDIGRDIQVDRYIVGGAVALVLGGTMPAHAQEVPPIEPTVFDGDYLAVGIGAAISPSYLGSDDYVVSPLPIVQASFRGVEISPRGAGVAVDFVADPESGAGLDLGFVARLRSDRASQISDPVVKRLGKLDRAVEVGPTIGVSFARLLNPYDSLALSGDLAWDVAGAHGGMVVTPSATYFTPLSRAMAASLSLSAQYADAGFHDYYFRVTPAQSVATGGALPAFDPDGGGFTSAGATLLLAFDLNGNIADGGLGLVVIGGYSRVLGKAKDSPFTSIRGTADQFFGGLGVGYTF